MPTRIGPRKPIRLFVAEWRLAKDKTQKQVAALLGVSEMQIHRWEAGKTLMTTDSLAAYAEVLGVDPTDFYRHPDTPSPSELLRQQTERVDTAIATLETLRRARG